EMMNQSLGTCPNFGVHFTLKFAERLQQDLRQALMDFSVGDIAATISLGAANISSEDRSYEDTLKRADDALYKAKRLGKDRIVTA
ncbi:hypothetical protein C9974_15285, partial [Marinobacter sp. B9-2]